MGLHEGILTGYDPHLSSPEQSQILPDPEVPDGVIAHMGAQVRRDVGSLRTWGIWGWIGCAGMHMEVVWDPKYGSPGRQDLVLFDQSG